MLLNNKIDTKYFIYRSDRLPIKMLTPKRN